MSPNREHRRSARRISIRMKVEGDPSEMKALGSRLPGSTVSDGVLLGSIQTVDASKAIEELRSFGDMIRSVEKNPKGFK